MLSGSECQILLQIRDCGGEETKKKRPLIRQISPRRASLRQGCVLLSSFLPPTGGQGSEQRHFSLTVRQRGRVLWGRPLCVIIVTKGTESKSKTQFQHGVRTGLFLNILRCRVYSGPPIALPLPQPLAPLTHLLSLDLPVLGVSYKWNHIVCDYSGLYVGVPSKSTCWNLAPKVMVWGGGASRRWWGHESRDLVNGINALMKQTPKRPPQPVLHVRMQWRPRPPPRTKFH